MSALFLDRDGVINHDFGYVFEQESFKFVDGIFEICKLAIDNEMKIVVITNQSGIGRGYFTEDEFLTLTTWMIAQFKRRNIKIDKVYYCPHLPSDGCECRKPNTKLVDKAKIELQLDLENSFLIGDKISDIDLARNAGIGVAIGIGVPTRGSTVNTNVFKVNDVRSAIKIIKNQIKKLKQL